MEKIKKYLAEFIGTFILVVLGCGTAAATGDLVATSLAFGLSIIVVAYTVGRVSGGHVNPAVSIAMAIRGDISWGEFLGYCLSQFLGAFVGSALLGLFFHGYKATGANSLANIAGLFGSQINFGIAMVGLVLEIVLTFFFVLAVLGATKDEKTGNIAGILIALALVVVHLLGFNLDGCSVNPARAFSALIFSLIGGAEAGPAWLAIFSTVVGPFIGGILAALCAKVFFPKSAE